MFKLINLKRIILNASIVVFSLNSLGVIACAPKPDSHAEVRFFPKPMFDGDLAVDIDTGKVKAKVWISGGGKLEKYEIIEITPKQLPIAPIKKSLSKARFDMLNGYPVSGQILEIEFEIVRKIKTDLELPEIETNIDK